jgi:hypothetical protein
MPDEGDSQDDDDDDDQVDGDFTPRTMATTTTTTTQLIVLQLEFCSARVADILATRLLPNCRMPQYPLHCALGVTNGGNAIIPPSRLVELERRVVGQELILHYNTMRELPPPPAPDWPVYRRLVRAIHHETTTT